MTQPATSNANATTTNPATIDLTQFVPKADADKLKSDYETRLQAQGTEIERLKITLLSDEYLAFLETQRSNTTKVESAVAKAANSLTADDMKNLPPNRVLELATAQAKEALLKDILPTYEKEINKLKVSLGDVAAILELQQIEKFYDGKDGKPNFADHREAVQKILESSAGNLTYEQALHIAIGQGSGKKTEPAPKPKAPLSERPSSTVPGEEIKQKNFSSESAAANDAWSQIAEKYGIAGDTL